MKKEILLQQRNFLKLLELELQELSYKLQEELYLALEKQDFISVYYILEKMKENIEKDPSISAWVKQEKEFYLDKLFISLIENKNKIIKKSKYYLFIELNRIEKKMRKKIKNVEEIQKNDVEDILKKLTLEIITNDPDFKKLMMLKEKYRKTKSSNYKRKIDQLLKKLQKKYKI